MVRFCVPGLGKQIRVQMVKRPMFLTGPNGDVSSGMADERMVLIIEPPGPYEVSLSPNSDPSNQVNPNSRKVTKLTVRDGSHHRS